MPGKKFFSMAKFFITQIEGLNLTIYGEGPERSKIEEFITKQESSSKVRLKPFLNQNCLFKKFCQFKFFLFFSEKPGEILPNVVKEAMLAGCIVVCKSIPSIDELIEDRIDGFLFNNYDEIPEILKMPNSELKNISKRASLKIKTNFKIESAIKKYEKFWSAKN